MNVLDFDKKFDFNYQYSKFFNQNDDDLNNLIKISLKNEIYISLIIMDFTFLNSLDNNLGYEPGTLLKELILKFLDNNKNKYKIIYQTITSSKIFFFSSNKIDSNFKQELFSFSEFEIKNKYSKINENIKKKLENKTLIYIVEKDNNNQYFTLNNYLSSEINEISFKLLFLKAFLNELNLNKLRNKINSFFDNKLEFKSNQESGNFEKQIINLFSFDKQINNLNSIKIDEQFNKIDLKNLKNSKYLSLAYQNFKNGYDIYHTSFLIIKYLIWIKMQELQFLGYKYEKVYFFFDRENETHEVENDKINKFTTKKDFLSWFNSSVEIFSSTMSVFNIEEKNKIKKEIEELNFDNFEKTKIIVKKIQLFFDNLKNPKGLFNIPLEKIKPNQYAIECLKNELYLNFSINYKVKFKEWLELKDNNKESVIREGLYTSINKAENMIYGLEFMNSNPNILKNKNIRCHIAFLEIDGFNSLNNIYFPNDSDSILYGKILEIMGKINLKYLEKYNQKFKAMITSIAGDEFYFSFLTLKDISEQDKKIFFNFLVDFRKEVLNQFSKIKYPKSQKEIVILKDNISVSFRKILFEKKKIFSKNKKIDIELTTIGITGCVLFNNSIIKDNKSPTEIFKEIIINIDSELTNNLKSTKRGLISIIDYKGKVLNSK